LVVSLETPGAGSFGQPPQNKMVLSAVCAAFMHEQRAQLL
jgi:hypothetical protein